MEQITKNTLFYGDNLKILKEYIPSESVDLIYLDPPFNSNRNYNVLFKDKNGTDSDAQVEAFEDTWHWNQEAEDIYGELVTNAQPQISRMIGAFREFIGTNQMMAYLVMMTIRLIELHRVLKPSGSLYLHCDPTASHYLKIVLDMIFGGENFKNEITWKRANAHNDPRKYGNVSDIILYYTKTDNYYWVTLYTPYDDKYVESHWGKKDSSDRYYRLMPLDAPRHGDGGNLMYEWRGKLPAPSRTWSCTIEKMMNYESQGLIEYTSKGTPCLKKYLDEMPGVPLQNIWSDIPPVNPMAAERLGYPTQKPIALLERIINASSNEGNTVLDPFCGCGTAIHAAEKLNRKWIGIDITHLAVALLKYRLKDALNIIEKQNYDVIGEPKDLSSAYQLAQDDRYQFQWWALSLIKAKPIGGQADSKKGKKGKDTGIDGEINFIDSSDKKAKRILVQVKSGKVKSGDIRDLVGTIERENAAIGVFITLEEPSKDMKKEAVSAGNYKSQIWNKTYPKIQILTIEELFNGSDVKMPPSHTTFKKAKRENKKWIGQISLF